MQEEQDSSSCPRVLSDSALLCVGLPFPPHCSSMLLKCQPRPYLSVRSLTNWHWKVLLTCFERAVVHLISLEAFTWDFALYYEASVQHAIFSSMGRGQAQKDKYCRFSHVDCYLQALYACTYLRASKWGQRSGSLGGDPWEEEKRLQGRG